MQILINHVGYAPHAPKRAILKCTEGETPQAFAIVCHDTGKEVFQGTPQSNGTVDRWKNWHFWTVDFSSLTAPGRYVVVAKPSDAATCPERSHPFEIRTHLIRETIADILYYFRAQRCADEFDATDKNLPIYNDKDNRTVDVHGGWYDASGDVSKYLSHLSYANFMNPQQTQLCVWSMFHTARELEKKHAANEDFGTERLIKKLYDEALYGADFLVRMQDPCGAFYMTVFDQWTADTSKRMICEYKTQAGHRYENWQCSHRQGAGMSIAALAIAARAPRDRDFTRETYLQTAIKGFDHVEEHGPSYCNDGKENIIDDYCALLAATELFITTKEQRFYDAAAARAKSLMARISSDDTCTDWLRADDAGKRTFFHASDAGLPILSLLGFMDVAKDDAKAEILAAVERLCAFELRITEEVPNPFDYPRQYITDADGNRRTSFFFAQHNESGYWWQGENARLGSLASAARAAARHVKPEMRDRLNEYAGLCIDWMLGMNPFDICMLHGRGHNNAFYEEGYPSAPGGVCNGATAGFLDPHDIDFNPSEPPEARTGNHRWRWSEQWIPHSGWYILAVSLENH
ncbi:MAG: hypothetical protein GX146_06595 [Myxococcales bacterium]|jgi:hypothetical protein|nr:hypothetical protein [Myxococcales bacterium]